MPTIAIEGSALGPAVSADVTGGGRLLDVCDDLGAPVAFSCRSARCGTCRVQVVAGQELLAPASLEERDVLERLGAAPSHRLACQAVVRPGPGLLLLRAHGIGGAGQRC